jgi:hypothetical protein
VKTKQEMVETLESLPGLSGRCLQLSSPDDARGKNVDLEAIAKKVFQPCVMTNLSLGECTAISQYEKT